MNGEIKINEINVNHSVEEIDPYLGGICGAGCGNAGNWCGLWCEED